MALTNVEKQRRFLERNQILLTKSAEDIAARLIRMEDQVKLRKVARYIGDHLKRADRTRPLRPGEGRRRFRVSDRAIRLYQERMTRRPVT